MLHFSGEYFATVPEYVILQSSPFEGQSTAEMLQMTVVTEVAPVINYGVGLEIFISKNLSMFGSFATDFAAIDSDENWITELNSVFSDNTFRADIFHFGFGTDIKTKFADLTVGATYASSRELIKRELTIDDGNDPVTSDAEIIWSRWHFLIGFEFHFIDQIKEKLEKKLN